MRSLPANLIAVIAVLASVESASARPNILFRISDDQSWAPTGANGDPVVKTPAFDRIAREGLRLRNDPDPGLDGRRNVRTEGTVR